MAWSVRYFEKFYREPFHYEKALPTSPVNNGNRQSKETGETYIYRIK